MLKTQIIKLTAFQLEQFGFFNRNGLDHVILKAPTSEGGPVNVTYVYENGVSWVDIFPEKNTFLESEDHPDQEAMSE